jgi:carbon-monoxide dehydrogenase large subunit
LHPEAGDNVALTVGGGGPQIDFGRCEVVVTQRVVNQRVAPAPLESRAAAAYWDKEGRLIQYSSNQGAHPVRDNLAEWLGIDPGRVRVVTPDVGGSFGAKARPSPEEVCVAWLARRLDRPVRWADTRTENMLAMGHGRGQVQTVTIGGSRDGRIEAYRLDVVQDAGAYPAMGALLPMATRLMASGVYAIPEVEFTARSAVTNTVPTIAYRGAGRPEAIAAIERVVDLFAAEIGLDPAEVRRRNMVPRDAFPFTNPTGAIYDSGDYAAALERVLDAAGYDELRAEQSRLRKSGGAIQLGIGIAAYVEITGIGGGGEFSSVQLRADGGARVLTGSSPHGQGHDTAWAMIAADRLQMPMDKIEVVHGDTDVVPEGGLTGGSRSLQLAGSAVLDASDRLLEMGRSAAAELLEADPSDIVLDGSGFHVAGTPAVSKQWEHIAEAATDHPLVAISTFSQANATFPFGAHVAVVEVDIETGKVVLRRLIACDDAGVILNPLLADGQVHGGLAQGAAQALFEETSFDADGNPLTTNFADYAIITAAELPSFERISMETPTPLNPLGAKGIGEAATIGATPAVQNAVIDAVRHLGVSHIDMPCHPERVWQAIQDATAGSPP